MLPINHVWVSVGTSRWNCCVSSRHVLLSRSCLECIWRWVWPEHCSCGDAWSCHNKKGESLNHIYPFAWVPTLGWSRLPRRKLRKIGLMLNLCPSHTEIFSKRRKIYSWLCERLELMWQLLKNVATSRALGNAFEILNFIRWKTIKLRPGEDVRW